MEGVSWGKPTGYKAGEEGREVRKKMKGRRKKLIRRGLMKSRSSGGKKNSSKREKFTEKSTPACRKKI